MTILYIKNMVCDRCKMAVAQALKNQNITFQGLELGEVMLQEPLPPEKLESFKKDMETLGFELIDDARAKIIEKIKTEIIKTIHHPTDVLKVNFSRHLVEKIGKEYSSLSALFSEVEGTTIEQYILQQKIEKVKELLVYDELTLSEIAHRLHYSSVAHLSNQFKKITGLTPSYFKSIKEYRRKPLDKVSPLK